MHSDRKYKLRNSIQISQEFQDQQFVFLLSCNYSFSESIILKQICAPVLNCLFDGVGHSEIQKFCSESGFQHDLVMQVIHLLDSYGYLEGASFINVKNKVIDQFKVSSLRKASHAGLIYPSQPEALKNFIHDILGKAPPADINSNPVCLIAPHIDYKRGYLAYAYAYRYLYDYKPDICVIFGTSHKGGKSLFQLTLKDFESPLKTLQNHKEFSQQITDLYGAERSQVDEFLHKNEHSIELQIPFLSCLSPETKIVPILVNSFYPFYDLSGIRENSAEYSDFIKAFCQTYKDFKAIGQKILIIAGVDMAHIGSDFGDSFEVDQQKQLDCEARDKHYLQSIENLSSNQMFSHITSDHDQRRICGFPCMHTILDILQETEYGLKSSIVHYQQAVDEKQKCLVSFASGIIYRTT